VTELTLLFAAGIGILLLMDRTRPSRTAVARRPSFVGLAFVLLLSGCAVHPDPDTPPPLLPREPAARTKVIVAPIENATASAEVAQWTSATRRFLVELLERSRNFEVVEAGAPGAAGTLFLKYTDVRDEPWLESVTFGAEQNLNRKRRAVVEMEWRFVAGSGALTAGERLSGDFLREGDEPIVLPTQDELEAGSFWESPFGAAARGNLDLVVRRLAQRG
jgi:hypothetical protein